MTTTNHESDESAVSLRAKLDVCRGTIDIGARRFEAAETELGYIKAQLGAVGTETAYDAVKRFMRDARKRDEARDRDHPLAVAAREVGRLQVDRCRKHYGYDSMEFAEARAMWHAMVRALGLDFDPRSGLAAPAAAAPKLEDNPPPGGYYKTGEWRDPEPRRNYNVNPDESNAAAASPADEATSPKRGWFARLLCAIGIHSDPVAVGLHRMRCYDCGREWSGGRADAR